MFREGAQFWLFYTDYRRTTRKIMRKFDVMRLSEWFFSIPLHYLHLLTLFIALASAEQAKRKSLLSFFTPKVVKLTANHCLSHENVHLWDLRHSVYTEIVINFNDTVCACALEAPCQIFIGNSVELLTDAFEFICNRSSIISSFQIKYNGE